MSRVKVNEITNKVATGPVDFPDGITGVALTVTGNVTVGGTIISEDTTNVDSVGWVTARSGLNVGPPSTGIGATVHSNGNAVFAGIVTASSFSGVTELTGSTNNTLVTVTGANAIQGEANLTYNGSVLALAGDDNQEIRVGAGADLTIKADGSNSAIVHNGDGDLIVKTDGTGEDVILQPTDALYLKSGGNNTRLLVNAVGSFTFDNGTFIEKVKITAGKLSDNTNIDLLDGMVHYFTTTETTTCTPNIRESSTRSVNDAMNTGDCITVTIITTAAAAAYAANITIDGGAVTENWIGGSAPSDGGSSGVDILTLNIIKTADATFTVLGNQSKTS